MHKERMRGFVRAFISDPGGHRAVSFLRAVGINAAAPLCSPGVVHGLPMTLTVWGPTFVS